MKEKIERIIKTTPKSRAIILFALLPELIYISSSVTDQSKIKLIRTIIKKFISPIVLVLLAHQLTNLARLSSCKCFI